MNCSKCGAEIAEGSAFCSACGERQTGQNQSEWTSSDRPMSVQSAVGAAASAKRVVYAGFWLRLVAFVVDLILLFVPIMLALCLLAISMGVADSIQKIQPGETPEQLTALLGSRFVMSMLVTLILGTGLYFSLFECSPWRATPGKKLLGLYVSDLAGNRLSFGRASARFFAGKLVVFALPGLGLLYFIMSSAYAGFTARKQALYDIVTKCLVVRHG